MVTPRRRRKMERVVARRQSGLVVVLEDIHDPHNAEAVLRTCDAFGVQDVYFIFEQEAYYNPRRVGKSTSASANKWLTLHVCRSTRDCLEALRAAGYQIVVTVVPDETTEDIFAADLTAPRLAVVFGNEHRGVSPAAVELAHRKMTIPMRGMVASLNISVSAAIFLFEITRQRLRSGGDFTLSAAEQRALLEDFLQGRLEIRRVGD